MMLLIQTYGKKIMVYRIIEEWDERDTQDVLLGL
jgi:hypothetical protein